MTQPKIDYAKASYCSCTTGTEAGGWHEVRCPHCHEVELGLWPLPPYADARAFVEARGWHLPIEQQAQHAREATDHAPISTWKPR